MKAVILCAGYATRLGKLTENTPKPLLQVKGKTLLDLLVDNLDEISDVDEIVVVSNHKFFQHFKAWAKSRVSNAPITILDDGSTCNDDRLGAIGDIKFALDKKNYKGEIMVLAGDNWFDFKLSDFYKQYLRLGRKNMVLGARTNDLKILRSHGVAKLDENGKVIFMEEKPQVPQGNFAVGPFYIYNKDAVAKLGDYLASGNSHDAPGNFPSWLSQITDVYAWDVSPKHRIDIGTEEVYYNIDSIIDSLSETNVR